LVAHHSECVPVDVTDVASVDPLKASVRTRPLRQQWRHVLIDTRILYFLRFSRPQGSFGRGGGGGGRDTVVTVGICGRAGSDVAVVVTAATALVTWFTGDVLVDAVLLFTGVLALATVCAVDTGVVSAGPDRRAPSGRATGTAFA
jgi:hypothetical protein